MGKIKFGTDIDGTLANFIDQARNEILKVHGVDVYADITDRTNQLLIDRYATSDPNLYVTLKPYPETAETLREMLNYCDITYITSRPEEAFHATLDWLTNNGFPLDKLIFSPIKSRIIKDLQLQTYVEDRWEVADEIAKECPETEVLLLERFYNKGYTPKYPNIRLVHCWSDVVFFTYFVGKVK